MSKQNQSDLTNDEQMLSFDEQLDGLLDDYGAAPIHPQDIKEQAEVKTKIQALIAGEVIKEFEKMWNATQPDTVPSGWTPDDIAGKYLYRRIAELRNKLKENE